MKRILTILLFTLHFSLFTCPADAQTVAHYKDNKAAAISYTFDDGLQEHYTMLRQKLKEHRFPATFAIVGSKVGHDHKGTPIMTWSQLRELKADGHEMSSHGYEHKNVTTLTTEELRHELQANDTLMHDSLGVWPLTFVYPGNRRTDEAIRICEQGRVGSRTSLMSLGGKTEGKGEQWLRQWVDSLIAKGQWAVTMTHGISYGYDHFANPEVLWRHFDYVDSLRTKIWVGTFAEVSAYVKEREALKLKVDTLKNGTIEVTPSLNLDSTLFNVPLTLIIPTTKNLKATQDGKALTVQSQDILQLLNFNPHGGKITISKHQTSNLKLQTPQDPVWDDTKRCLWQSFLTPPDSIRVGCYYYWVNERVDPKGVKADLQWMKDNGITLAFLATDIRNRTRWENPWEGETFGKNKFQSKLWWKNVRTALKTASELDIEMGIFNCPGWSQSGGSWVKPEEAMRNWTPQGIEICKTKEGTDVTCGPCSPEAEGLEVDKLSKTHVKKHFEAFFGEILRRIPPRDRPTLTTVVVDSWERGKQNYTDSIFVKFRQRFGYELDYQNEACQKDLNQLISDLVASEYMGGLTEKAHEYGLRTWCEPYAHSPFPGNSITYGSAADEVAAEFWVNDRKYRQKEVDAAVGAARRSGKNRVWAESFTDGAWDKVAQDDWSFEKLKPIADRYFHAGINATILHVMISQPGDDREPAVRPWFGTFFDRRSQHAADLKPLVQYLRRCNFMLQLGRPLDGATDQRILDNGTIIRFTDDSQFEVTFPNGQKEVWNPTTLMNE